MLKGIILLDKHERPLLEVGQFESDCYRHEVLPNERIVGVRYKQSNDEH